MNGGIRGNIRMSNIGNIYARFGEALQLGLNDLEASRQQSNEGMQLLYQNLFGSFIQNYLVSITDASKLRAKFLRIIEKQFNEERQDVIFAANEGDCGKVLRSEAMVLYAAPYAQNATPNLGKCRKTS